MTDYDRTLYKIGHTKNQQTLKTRIKNIQTGCPHKINLLETFESEYNNKIEKSLHRSYSYCNINGEWFELDINDVVLFTEKCKIFHNSFKVLDNKEKII